MWRSRGWGVEGLGGWSKPTLMPSIDKCPRRRPTTNNPPHPHSLLPNSPRHDRPPRPSQAKPKQKDGESGSKMGWLGRPTRRSKRSATLTGSYTMSQSMPTNPNSEIVKAAASAQVGPLLPTFPLLGGRVPQRRAFRGHACPDRLSPIGSPR